MRFRDLERMLSSLPPHPSPKAELEQYATPGDLAARLLSEAVALGDIAGKRVVDLGCGTGVLAIGASLLGAQTVVGVDVDDEALDVARREGGRLHATDVSWTCADVAGWQGVAHTVIMNPPFGAQKPGADRPFLETAMRTAPVIYSLHNASTRGFVQAFAAERGFTVSHAWAMRFPLRQQYRHQSRAVVEVDVLAVRLVKRT